MGGSFAGKLFLILISISILIIFFSGKSLASDISLKPLELEEELVKQKVKKIPTGAKMVFIKGGCYEMGDNFGDGESDEKPVHTTCVNDFYLGETEVTQAQWESIMGRNPSRHKGTKMPVESVRWNDVQEFLKRLNEKAGGKYRLPTEAEWEYGAREGGKKIKYGTGKNGISQSDARYDSADGTVPVKSYTPNAVGLYDMSGNVWELCADWYDENYYKNFTKDNPKGPSSGYTRVLRGGSWVSKPNGVRVSVRGGYISDTRYNNIGFRLAR